MENQWFGSTYYNLLYSHRNPEEAKNFTENILKVLSLPPKAKIWDMACGSGRHAISFANKNYCVTATDSSNLCIIEAKKINNHPNIKYFIHNYIHPIYENHYDLVLNLFTSLGYSREVDELDLFFLSAHKSLKNKGFLLVDFLNPIYVKTHLISNEQIIKNNIFFNINRSIVPAPPAVSKNIEVITESDTYNFMEWVRLYETSDFLISAKNKFNLVHQWGDYDLKNWNHDSPRNIMLFVKI